MLQIVLAIVGLILVGAGFLGLINSIKDDFYSLRIENMIQGNIILDSNMRFASGTWLGIGLLLFWIIPGIEKQKIILRSLSFLIFLGGIGRVISILTAGNPSPIFVIFTLLELLFPVFIIWQNSLEYTKNASDSI